MPSPPRRIVERPDETTVDSDAPSRPTGSVLLTPAAVLVVLTVIPPLMGWQASEMSAPALPVYRIDLSTADLPDLQLLPGVGPAVAERIIVARQSRPFTSLDDLTRVRGIGTIVTGRLAPHVTASAPE